MFIYTVNLEEANQIAETRELGKTGFKSHRPLSESYEIVGVMGEQAFSQFSGLPLDTERRLDGDKGVDFHLPFRVDVKASRNPKNLLVEKGKVLADIYVLAKANPDLSPQVTLLGWTWGYVVASSQVDNGHYFARGVTYYYVPAAELYPMEKLQLICRALRQP